MAKRSHVLAILCLLAILIVPSLSSASTTAAPMPRAHCFALTVADSARASSASASRAAFEAAGASHTGATIAGVVASIAGPRKFKSAAKLSWRLVRQGGKRAAATAVGGAGATGGTTVIGKLDDLKNLRAGEQTMLGRLPDRGTPQANWHQSSGVLRQEMGRGLPIRDASVDSAGTLINNTGFLRAERNLLQSRDWTYNPSTTMWHPPVGP